MNQEEKSLSVNIGSPNVVLIVMDTVRGDHVSVNGYQKDTTPNLRKLCKEATLYTRAIAPGDMTLPSLASMLTGLYARQHGAHFDIPDAPGGRPLHDKFQTVVEILSEKGYFTMGVVANTAFLTHTFGFSQGFQYYDQRSRVPFLGETRAHYIRQGIRDVLTYFTPPSVFDLKWRRAEQINRDILPILQKARQDNKPFFLLINYMDAHWPYIPPSPYDVLYPGKVERFTTKLFSRMKNEVMNLERNITEGERGHLVSQYDGAIAYIDYHIGKLIRHLRETDLYNNSLIIITSDHGEAFGRRNIIEHAYSAYQDEIHVPLIIKYPDVNEARVVDEKISLLDIAPTILDVLGYDILERFQGVSLLRIEASSKPRILISESFRSGNALKRFSGRFDPVQRAIFSGSLKFIKSTSEKRELYDLSIDFDETSNLFNPNDHVSAELEEELDQWLERVVEVSSPPAHLDEETIDRLKSLGYIQ